VQGVVNPGPHAELATLPGGHAFELTPRPFGRVEGVSFENQVRFEGWILGVA
jgi:hypothetical protein